MPSASLSSRSAMLAAAFRRPSPAPGAVPGRRPMDGIVARPSDAGTAGAAGRLGGIGHRAVNGRGRDADGSVTNAFYKM